MNKIYVAKLGKTIGLKGEQKIYIDSDFPEQFKKGAKFFTNKGQELVVESINFNNDSIKFQGINDVESAKKLTNKELFTSLEQSKENCNLEDNQYFWFDLIGCKIVENGEVLGEVSDIQRLPLDDYFVINTSQDLVEKEYAKSFMIPYIDTFIQKVDLEVKEIYAVGAKDILEAS